MEEGPFLGRKALKAHVSAHECDYNGQPPFLQYLRFHRHLLFGCDLYVLWLSQEC